MSLTGLALNALFLRVGRAFDAYPWRAYEARFWRLREDFGRPFRLDIFRPEIFIFAYLAFLLLGIRVASQWTLVSIAALAAFYFGTKLSRRFDPAAPRWCPPLNLLLLISLVAILAGLYDLNYIGGTPLLDPSLFQKHLVLFVTAAFLIVPATTLILASTGQNNLPKTFLLFLLTALLMALLGYRTEVVVALVSFAATLSYLGELRRGDVLLLCLLLVGSIVGLGLLKASSTSPIDVLTTRAETALAINDYIAKDAGLFGAYHGRVHLSGLSTLLHLPGPRFGPRTLIANAVSSREGVTITATILGPMLLDFGIIGAILELGLLGLLLGYMHRSIGRPTDAAVYAVLLSFALVSIETGLVDGIVLIYYALGTLYFALRAPVVQPG